MADDNRLTPTFGQNSNPRRKLHIPIALPGHENSENYMYPPGGFPEPNNTGLPSIGKELKTLLEIFILWIRGMLPGGEMREFHVAVAAAGYNKPLSKEEEEALPPETRDARERTQKMESIAKEGRFPTAQEIKDILKGSLDEEIRKNPYKFVLAIIASKEALNGNSYDSVSGSQKETIVFRGVERRPTTMKMWEIKEWQEDQRAKGASTTALGILQINYETLFGERNKDGTLKMNKEGKPIDIGYAGKIGLKDDDYFNEKTQEALFKKLVDDCGLPEYLEGKKSVGDFIWDIAGRWAALSKDASNKSHYEGVGTNKARIPYGTLVTSLEAIKNAQGSITGQTPRSEVSSSETPPPSPRGGTGVSP